MNHKSITIEIDVQAATRGGVINAFQAALKEISGQMPLACKVDDAQALIERGSDTCRYIYQFNMREGP